MSSRKAVTVSGYLKPRHGRGTKVVRIYRYKRTASGRWKSYGYVTARTSDYSTYSKYSLSLKLPKGRWRLRAHAPTDSLHASAWSSGYRYVTVK